MKLMKQITTLIKISSINIYSSKIRRYTKIFNIKYTITQIFFIYCLRIYNSKCFSKI